MKTTFKVMLAIFALGFVILLGLHLFLQHGLTKTLREVVLPRVKAETGIDARVGALSINLANGLLHLNDVELKNPPGFLLENLASVGRVTVEVDLFSLFRKKPIHIKHVEVESLLVNVIRNKRGEFNLDYLQPAPPPPARPVPDIGKPAPGQVPEIEKKPAPSTSPTPAPAPRPPRPTKPLPEMFIKAMQCNAQVRYLDLKLDQLDLLLDLDLIGRDLSTQRDPDLPWGELAVIGALGDDRTSFVTDLQIRLAPLANPQAPSFDLSGKVLEIDPRIMDEMYSRLGIRSAPFGLVPEIHCRNGRFQDSQVSLTLTDVVFESKLADRLGGMGSIGSLRFPVLIKGTVQQPIIDWSRLLSGLGQRPADLAEVAIEALGRKVSEIGESEAVKKVLKDLAGGGASDTNAPSSINSDALIDILGENVDDIGENEELKKELKNMGKYLFGK